MIETRGFLPPAEVPPDDWLLQRRKRSITYSGSGKPSLACVILIVSTSNCPENAQKVSLGLKPVYASRSRAQAVRTCDIALFRNQLAVW